MDDQPADPTPPQNGPKPAARTPKSETAGTQDGSTAPRPRPRPRPPAAKPAETAEAAGQKSGSKKATRAQTPAKRMVTAAVNAVDAVQEVLDEKLLAHLDDVLAELEPPTPTSPAAPATPLKDTEASVKVETAPPAEGSIDRSDVDDPIGDVPGAGPHWLRTIVADPGFAAEHLADEAVQRLGPQARAWHDRLRERYPTARPDALAQLAVAEHVGLARRQGLASTTAAGAIIDLGLVGRTQARLVLTVAACYGLDPADPARADELVQLLAWPRLTEPGLDAARHAGRLVSALVVRRVAARLLPFGAAVAGAIHSGQSTETIGRRAIDRYRPR